MTDFCIEYRDVTKSYGNKTILESLSLRIPANVTTAIVGESGSGKSTLLQMANGLVLPDSGQVSVLESELDADNRISKRLQIGYSVQGAALFPHLSVSENITIMATLLQWPADKTRARLDTLIELLEVDRELLPRYPFSLSGGQQQRVSLCRAMMLNPPLLLLDEPFSALDPLTRESIQDEFHKIQAVETRSMVLVTHDMQEALKLAQEIIVLREGKVEQQAAATEIQANPANEYVSSLFNIGVA